jgi:hypothetical protein
MYPLQYLLATATKSEAIVISMAKSPPGPVLSTRFQKVANSVYVIKIFRNMTIHRPTESRYTVHISKNMTGIENAKLMSYYCDGMPMLLLHFSFFWLTTVLQQHQTAPSLRYSEDGNSPLGLTHLDRTSHLTDRCDSAHNSGSASPTTSSLAVTLLSAFRIEKNLEDLG